MAKKREIEVEVPGEAPAPAVPTPAEPDPAIAADLAADQEAVADALIEPPLPTIEGAAPEYVPDQAEVDSSRIPHGQSVMTRQGLVCSTAEDPRRLAQAAAILKHGSANSRA
jgi:hypothetical protein